MWLDMVGNLSVSIAEGLLINIMDLMFCIGGQKCMVGGSLGIIKNNVDMCGHVGYIDNEIGHILVLI